MPWLLRRPLGIMLEWVPILGEGIDALILPSITVGLFLAGGLARLIRSAIIETLSQDYIRAAHAKGLSAFRIVAKHAMRNAIIPPNTQLGVPRFARVVRSATLSFLGLGAQPPTPEWGAMLNAGREFMRYAPWTMIFPGLVLFLAVMSVNLVGDRLSHVLDPRASGHV